MLNFLIFYTYIKGSFKNKKSNNFFLNSLGCSNASQFIFFKNLQIVDFFVFKNERFEVFFNIFFNENFYSIKIIKKENSFTSLSSFVSIAEWYEREVSDFEIFTFRGAKDSRPLLLQYNSCFFLTKKKNNFIFYNALLNSPFFFSKNKIKL